MATTEQQIDSFAQFARGQLAQGGEELSIDELFDRWRLEHPPAEDVLAIKASVRDMQGGETGQPFEEFADEFRQRNHLSREP